MIPLTKPQGEELAALQADTVRGMAFWAGTGEPGKTCRECLSWGVGKKFKRDRWGELMARRCSKYARMSGRSGPGVPHHKAACKYFENSPRSPVAMTSKKDES